MSSKKYERNAREEAVRILSQKGYRVTDVSSGTGVPKLSRLLVEKDGNEAVCMVKYTTTGRIHFVHEDNTFKVLDEADLVLHVNDSSSDKGRLVISLFEKSTVEKAFQAARTALKNVGQDHIPIWLNPKFEEGVRFTGSGFENEAIWAERTSIEQQRDEGRIIETDLEVEEAVLEGFKTPRDETDRQSGVMARFKKLLAEEMGVRAEQLEIDVRIKL